MRHILKYIAMHQTEFQTHDRHDTISLYIPLSNLNIRRYPLLNHDNTDSAQLIVLPLKIKDAKKN